MAGNNLGTAWIQIKPSMKGMTSSIRSELSGIGSAEGASAGNSFSTAFAAKIGAVSAITERVLGGAVDIIKNQISDAVYRVDVLERFPKVMEMMGYSAQDASNAIEKLKKGVEGIPTPLSDVVTGAQRIASITGDVDKAADWTMAISDAMLVTTGDVNEASRGMHQFLQILSRGKPLGEDWNTIMEVASPIMNKLAKSMGYVGAEVGSDFYNALQKGTLSVEDMMTALVELDQNGGEGIEALNKQVRTATGGIESTITLLKQTISNVIRDIIMEIGSDNIKDVINGIKDVLVSVTKVIGNIIIFIKDNWSWLQYVAGSIAIMFAGATVLKAIMKLKNMIVGVGTTIKGIFGKAAQTTVAKNAGNMFKGVGSAIKGALTSLKDILVGAVQAVMEPIKTLLKGVGEAIAGFFKAFASPEIALGAAMFALAAASIAAAIFLIGSAIGAVMPALTELFNNIIMPIAQFIAETLLTLITTVTESIVILTNEALMPLGEFLVNSFTLVLQTVSDAITNLTQGALVPLINSLSGAFTNVINSVANLLTGVIKVALEGVAEVAKSVGEGFKYMGEGIKSALEGVQGVLQTFADLIKSIASAAVAMVALVTGHSINYGSDYAHLFAEGGRVTGPGTATSDSIPAYLSNGEYVIKASTAQRIGYDELDELNNTGHIRGGQTNYFTINGYNKSPEELANIISRKIAFNTKGVIG